MKAASLNEGKARSREMAAPKVERSTLDSQGKKTYQITVKTRH